MEGMTADFVLQQRTSLIQQIVQLSDRRKDIAAVCDHRWSNGNSAVATQDLCDLPKGCCAACGRFVEVDSDG
jgi:hypothetical protein